VGFNPRSWEFLAAQALEGLAHLAEAGVGDRDDGVMPTPLQPHRWHIEVVLAASTAH